MLISHRSVQEPYVRVFVGPKRKLYQLPKDLLGSKSVFFKQAFGSRFREAQEMEVLLPEEDPEIFEILVYWMYRGNLDLFDGLPFETTSGIRLREDEIPSNVCDKCRVGGPTCDGQPCCGINGLCSIARKARCETAGILVSLYFMADKFLVDGLKELAMELIRINVAAAPERIVPSPETIIGVFQQTIGPCPLRDFVVDSYVQANIHGVYQPDRYAVVHQTIPDFHIHMFRAIREYMTFSRHAALKTNFSSW